MLNDAEEKSDETIHSFFSGVLVDLQELAEQQLELTKAELVEELNRRVGAAKAFAVATFLLMLASVLFCLSLVHLLHWMASPVEADLAWLPLWSCYAVMATVLGGAGGLAASAAQRQLEPTILQRDSVADTPGE